MKTNKDITGRWFGYEEMTIPKGTQVTRQSACGLLPEGEYFIDSFSWVPKWPDGSKKSGFLHDATHRGIRVFAPDVEE